MASTDQVQQLTTRIARLTPAKLALVESMVDKLETSSGATMTVEEAVEEFEREHPELLRLLAQ